MSQTTVLALVGSLRSGSINQKLAETAAAVAPEDVKVELFEGLADIPFYNEDIDIEGQVPAAAAKLREAASEADSLLLISPEYNGTMPAVLKNAIDWLSRPYGAGAVTGMPAAVIGTAFGQYGGVWAHDEARKSLGVAGARVVEDAKLSIGGSLVRFAETHPTEDSEIAAEVARIVTGLVEARSAVAA